MNKFLKGDLVLIKSGNQKNKIGKILNIIGNYVNIENIKLKNKFFKYKFLKKIKYGYKLNYIFIHISNIILINDDIFSRTGFIINNFKKIRYLKKNGYIL